MDRAKYVVPVLLGLFYSTLASNNPEDLLVNTKVGPIRGIPGTDGPYSMYLGIPYATVNASNPFGVSIPHPGFNTTFEAYDDTIVCPQREEFNHTLVGTLDCLRLNVYVPDGAGPNSRLPVLVHIYGGGFVMGFAGRFQYDPKYLVKQEVIVVTFNYRLGAYGFLCLDIPEVPGNQGLKDQLTALRWIKNNIEAFGGDSEKITVSGQSAGAVSVDLHLTYTEEDLFDNVIIQSGTSLTPFAVVDSDPDAALKLAADLGYKTSSTYDALAFLSTKDSLYVVAAAEAYVRNAPCVEKRFSNVQGFITDHPTRVSVPKAKTVPIMIGFTDNELGPLYGDDDTEELKKLRVFTQLNDYFQFNETYAAEMEEIVRHFYIGDEEMNEDTKEVLADFSSDFNFNHPTYRSIQKYIGNGERNIYFYMFSYDGDRNFVKVKNNVQYLPGALHADELGYLFAISILGDTPNPDDQDMIDRMTTMWTNFAKYSDPTPVTTDIIPLRWPSIQKDALYCLNIDRDLTVQKRPLKERMAFWDMFYKLNGPYLKTYSSKNEEL